MNSRLVKTLNLISILMKNYESREYISNLELQDELKTDERNIRRIIEQINQSSSFRVQSKNGISGGYRLEDNILLRLFSISERDFAILLDVADFLNVFTEKSEIIQKYQQFLRYISNIDRISLTDMKNNPYYSYYLSKDIDYLRYIERVKEEVLSHDLWLSKDFEYNIYTRITYLTPESRNEFDMVLIDDFQISKSQYYCVYDLEDSKIRILSQKYIAYSQTFEDDRYSISDITLRLKGINKDEISNLILSVQNQDFVKIILNDNIHAETRQLILKEANEKENNDTDVKNYTLVMKSHLPMLLMQDYFLYNEIDIPDKIKLGMIDESKIIENYEYAISYSEHVIHTKPNNKMEKDKK